MRILFGLVLTVAMIGMAGFNAFAEDNVLLNAGLEEGEVEWYNWNDGDSSGDISSEYSNTGSNSACREVCGSGKGCYGQIVSISPGQTIKASVWVINPSATALLGGAEVYLRLEFWGNEGPLNSGHIESVHINKATDKWIKLDVEGVAPADAEEIRILAFNTGSRSSSTGKAYFDDFQMVIDEK